MLPVPLRAWNVRIQTEYAAPNELRHIKSTLKAQRREFRLSSWPGHTVHSVSSGLEQPKLGGRGYISD